MLGQRFLPNPYAAGPVPTIGSDACWAQVNHLLPELDQCSARGAVTDASNSWVADFSVYTGLGGLALTYLRVGLYCRDVRADPDGTMTYLKKAHSVAALCLKKDPYSNEVSFFCGTPGYIAISCVSNALLGNYAAADEDLKDLLAWEQAALKHREDELLFGRAGYIYALLWVKRYFKSKVFDCTHSLRRVAERLVATGKMRAARAYQKWPLMWHCFDEPYLGAAHGVVGVLGMLFHCYELLVPDSQQLVCGTLEMLLSKRYKSGNIPIILGDRKGEHVHWCHGAPGLPGLLAAARNVIGDPNNLLKDSALQAGEVVWERGVLLKGNGLCHGIAGNGYAFLSLYRLTGNDTYLQRAIAFAALLNHSHLQERIARHPDQQRMVNGVPDSPRSLMEGSAGIICFLLDVSAPEKSSFPAWEL